MSEEDTSFNPDCVEKLLKSYMKEGVRISKDGSIASAEYLRLFVVEAVHRANMKADNRGVVTAKDIQRILPELFLDF